MGELGLEEMEGLPEDWETLTQTLGAQWKRQGTGI